MAGAVLFDEKSLKVLLSSQLFRGTPNRPPNMKCMVRKYLEIGLSKIGDALHAYKPPSQEMKGMEVFL